MQTERFIPDNRPFDITSNFKSLFYPESMAFLGASQSPLKWGFRLPSNTISGGYQGRIYPVNLNRDKILGLKAYAKVADIPETPDLAIFTVPPDGILKAMKECVAKGIKAGVVITAGFAEVGKEGKRLQQEMVQIARNGGMILVGPNCMGIANSAIKLYCQMPPFFPRPGPLAVVSQSGNIVGTLMRNIMVRGFGCSKCISSGNEADLHAEDYLRYLADDPQTSVILSYIEGFKDGARFFQTAKEMTKKKPIIMLKAGETPAGAKAAMSHTASLAGSDAVFDAICKQAGVIRARTIDELIDTGVAFLCHPLPRGRRVGIISAGGGWAVLAADASVKAGLDVVSFPPETIKELDDLLPSWWNKGNPVDMVAGAFGDTLFRVLEVVLRCPAVDGAILLGVMPALPAVIGFMPSASADEMIDDEMTNIMPAAIAAIFDRITELARRNGKPVIVASDLPTDSQSLVQEIDNILAEKNHVCYAMPHQAAAAFASLAKYSEYLQQNGAKLQ
jgi:acyl-CoA synthetase (NDP forming)